MQKNRILQRIFKILYYRYIYRISYLAFERNLDYGLWDCYIKKIIRNNDALSNNLTLHSLRGSCISILVHEGIDIKDIQEWVGHKDIKTTLNIYAQINEKEKEKVNQKMCEVLLKM